MTAPNRKRKLLRAIGVNRVRHKDAGAEKSQDNCCKLDHDTHPRAQPALNTYNAVTTDLFQDDFVPSRKWFRRWIIWVPPPRNAHRFHKLFILPRSPAVMQTLQRNVLQKGRHALTRVIHRRHNANTGERSWAMSSDLYREQNSSGCGSAEQAARGTIRRPLSSASRGSRRTSW